jgi:hypothetical protein
VTPGIKDGASRYSSMLFEQARTTRSGDTPPVQVTPGIKDGASRYSSMLFEQARTTHSGDGMLFEFVTDQRHDTKQ